MITKYCCQILMIGVSLCSAITHNFAEEPILTPTSDEKSSHNYPKESVIFPFSIMSANERLSTGIEKLTIDEQQKLLSWILSRDMGIKEPSIGTVVAIKEDGKIVDLADGTSYTINPSHRKLCSKWSNNDQLEITALAKSKSFIIKNQKTKETVKAKLNKEAQKK